MSDAARDEWIQRARAATIGEVAERVLNLRLPRAGELQTACPACGGTDRFALNDKKGVWLCRGAKGGNDAIGMIEHALGVDFLAAVEIITGEPPPGRDSAAPARDPAIDKERREEKRDADFVRRQDESVEMRAAIDEATAFFDGAAPISGTIAEDYLEARGILLHQIGSDDLRFFAFADYWGFPDPKAQEQVLLGRFHCMVAAIRDVEGRIIGCHRTFLDAGKAEGERQPSGRAIKLRPPGDRNRNAAKKVLRHWRGGLIRLGPIEETVAIGEGIESTCSWRILADQNAFGDDFVGVSIAAGVALGNLSGGATGTIPHPNPPKGRASASIMNREPDPEKPGLILPPHVRRLILILDEDSDPTTTRAQIITGARRYAAAGVEVMVSRPGPGLDFNDLLLAGMKESAA